METWRPEIPPLGTWLWLAPAALVWAFFSGWLAGRLRVRGARDGDTRKVFHFLIFTAAAAVSAGLGFRELNLFGGVVALYVTAVTLRGEGNRVFEALARESDRPRRALLVIVPLAATAAGGIAAALLFGKVALVGFLVTGWGDAVAEPVGIRLGRHRYRVPGLAGVVSYRSFEGSAAVLVASLLAAGVGLAFLGLGPPVRLFVVAGSVATVAVLVEAFTPHGLDNLTLTLAASGTAWLLL